MYPKKGCAMAFMIMPCELRAAAIGTQLLARIPVLYDLKYRCHAPASRYLLDIGIGRWVRRKENREAHTPSAYARPRVPSDGSITTYGRQLENFITHCERHHIEWRELDYQELLDQYINPMKRGKLAPSTVNGRLHTAVDFLDWAAHAGERGPFKVVAEAVASDPRKSSTPRCRLVGSVRSHPEDLWLPDRSAIEEWLIYIQNRDSHTANVDALMCWTLLQTGLRAEEVLRLRVSCLRPVKAPGPHDHYATLLIQYGTKGGREPGDREARGKPRRIMLSLKALEKLQDYAHGRREIALRTYRRKNPGATEPKELFLSPDTGGPIAYRTFWGKWKIGPVPLPQWSPHLGRHTWACYTLLDEVFPMGVGVAYNVPDLPRLVQSHFEHILTTLIKPQLGHISSETTEMYLRWLTTQIQVSPAHREYANWLDGVL